MAIRAILLDLDNTLFDYDQGERIAFLQTLDAFNLPHELYPRYQVINKSYWERLERGEVTKEALRIGRFKDLFDEFGIDCVPLEVADDYVVKLSAASILFEHSIEVLKALKAHFPLAAVTNGIEAVQMSRLALSGIGDYFDAIVISERIGVNKPHPKIFEAALEGMGFTGSYADVLMVGDNYKADIQGAKTLGMTTCWMNYNSITRTDTLDADYVINSIDEILKVINLG